MSRHHAQLIRTIFHDPPSGNVHWREIESLLRHVGATREPISGARIRLTAKRMAAALHRPHHSKTLDTNVFSHLLRLPSRCGVTPSQYEGSGEGPT